MSVAYEQLLASLIENSMVKAALLLDMQGRIKGSRGQAQMLRNNNSASIQIDAGYSAQSANQANKPKENVYLLELREGILAVIFQDDVDFERIRKLTDTLIEHLQVTVA